jgi:hypothetical protein
MKTNKTKTYYVIEYKNLKDKRGLHRFEITTDYPKDNFKNLIKTDDGLVEYYKNYMIVLKNFDSKESAIKHAESKGAVKIYQDVFVDYLIYDMP